MAINAGQSFTGKVGVPFSQTPAYTGDINYWKGSGLPEGLTIDESTGLISGTPTTVVSISPQLNGYGGTLTGVSKIAATKATSSLWEFKSDSIALNSDGSVFISGGMDFGSIAWTQIVEVAAANTNFYALKSDGTVMAAKSGNGTSIPDIPAGLSNVTAISSSNIHVLALKNDGTVVGWGDNPYGEATIPSGLSSVIAVAAGGLHSLALKSDGTVVGWGGNAHGQTDIPIDLTNVIAISAGFQHSLALKSDGTVVGWGENANGQTNIPINLTNVIAISAGSSHSLALKSDGTVVGWGGDAAGQGVVPTGLSNVSAISAGTRQSYAVKNDGTVVGWGAMVFPSPTSLYSTIKKITAGIIIPNFVFSGAIDFEITAGSPLISASQSFTGAVGVTFSQTPALTNSANRPATNWTATGLPSGLSINATTGAITGTPQDSGSATITLTATGPGGSSSPTSANITIAAGAPLITFGQSFTGTVGIAFSQTPALTDATDRPATNWSAIGLPAGLSINTGTGAITGTPSAVGSYTASVTATGPGGASAATNIAITISASGGGGGGGGITMSILLAENQTYIATLGAPFSQTPALLLGTATSWYASGLPEWASINATSGAITGTPTFSGNAIVTVTAKASDNATSTVLLFLKTTSWNTLEIFVDPKARRVLSKADNKSPLSKITLKRDDRLPFRIIFVDGTTPFSIPDSFSVSVGLKKSYTDTDYLAYSTSATGTLDLSSEEIQALFLSNTATIPTLLEVRWEDSTSSFRTVTLPADLQNSVIRGNEYSPSLYLAADATISAAATSAAVRGLSSPIFGVVKGNSYQITIFPEARRISIAYPSMLGELSSVRYTEFNNAEVSDTFTKTTVQVTFPNASIQYFVYTYIAAVPFDDYATYTVTI